MPRLAGPGWWPSTGRGHATTEESRSSPPCSLSSKNVHIRAVVRGFIEKKVPGGRRSSAAPPGSVLRGSRDDERRPSARRVRHRACAGSARSWVRRSPRLQQATCGFDLTRSLSDVLPETAFAGAAEAWPESPCSAAPGRATIRSSRACSPGSFTSSSASSASIAASHLSKGRRVRPVNAALFEPIDPASEASSVHPPFLGVAPLVEASPLPRMPRHERVKALSGATDRGVSSKRSRAGLWLFVPVRLKRLAFGVMVDRRAATEAQEGGATATPGAGGRAGCASVLSDARTEGAERGLRSYWDKRSTGQ